MKLKYKYAIGCLVQWYEVEIVHEYIESVKRSLQNIDNKENVIVDICFNMAQNLEQIDESQMKLDDIFHRFLKIRADLDKTHIKAKVNFYPNTSILKEHDYHIDYQEPHTGALLALNTCDGYTKIRKTGEKYPSVANTLLTFDPSKEHCSTTTTNAIGRFNININYQ